MDLELKNKKVLITASSSGIGKAIAFEFAKEGADIFVHGRDKDSLILVSEQLKEYGVNAKYTPADLSTKEGVDELISEVKKAGGVDILVNNAGLYINHDWNGATAESWMNLYFINVVAGSMLNMALLPHMRNNGFGRIIQIASGEATQRFAFMPDYAATKAALVNTTVSLSKFLKNTGVTVNTVSPGIVATEGLIDFYKDFGKKAGWPIDSHGLEKKILETVLENNTGRLGKPEDVARLVCFIASPKSDYINGANYRVDGGSTVVIN